MKNQKGQALVEFIIILPVLVYVLLIMIDIFVIYNKKSGLEGRMEEVVYLYKNNRSSEISSYLNKDLENVHYKTKTEGNYTYIIVDMEYEFMTPGISNILGKKYDIKCERVIVNEN